MLLLGIYLISFMVVWYAYLHKLPPYWCICVAIKIFDFVYNIHFIWFETISLCVKQKLYDISCNFIMCIIDFIMCRIRDFALFLIKICRIIQKYPPFCRKDFFQKTFMYIVYNVRKYLQWDFFRPTPLYIIYYLKKIKLQKSYSFIGKYFPNIFLFYQTKKLHERLYICRIMQNIEETLSFHYNSYININIH